MLRGKGQLGREDPSLILSNVSLSPLPIARKILSTSPTDLPTHRSTYLPFVDLRAARSLMQQGREHPSTQVFRVQTKHSALLNRLSIAQSSSANPPVTRGFPRTNTEGKHEHEHEHEHHTLTPRSDYIPKVPETSAQSLRSTVRGDTPRVPPRSIPLPLPSPTNLAPDLDRTAGRQGFLP